MNDQKILEELKKVIYPGFKKSIVEFGFVKSTEPNIVVEIVSSKPEIIEKIKSDIEALNLGRNIIINSPKLEAEKSNSKSGKNIAPQIKNFVMISSGKGGVGKSTTTLNLAISMAKQGKKVGLLDADIYGPNIPRMLGVLGEQPNVVGNKLKPILTHGIEMMSMGVLIAEGEGLIWRGAMIMKAITQLLNEVLWGDLDILFIDMPPGTGDAQITLAQSVPVTAGVCVTTPQTVALDDSARSLDMFEKLHIPISGIVENMSGFICPDNGKEYDIFGKGGALELAKEYDTIILAQIPIEPMIRIGGDDGKPISFYDPNSVSAKRYDEAVLRLWETIEQINKSGGGDNSAIQPDTNHKPH